MIASNTIDPSQSWQRLAPKDYPKWCEDKINYHLASIRYGTDQISYEYVIISRLYEHSRGFYLIKQTGYRWRRYYLCFPVKGGVQLIKCWKTSYRHEEPPFEQIHQFIGDHNENQI